MKKILFVLSFISVVGVFAQKKDTSSTKAPDNLRKGVGANGKDTITDMGVAVAPSSMHFRVKPGKSSTQYLTITNDTRKQERFKISFSDFTMDNSGRINQLPMGQQAKEFGLTKWIVASPPLVELQPGEKKKVAITINLPETDEAYRAAWAMMMVDKVNERGFLAPDKTDEKSMTMGVIPTYGFGIHIFQSPPNVVINKVEIISFNLTYDDSSKFISLKVKNMGDGIGYCKSYIEITNEKTGKTDKEMLKQFVVFPGLERNFDFKLPGTLTKGTNQVLIALDFGSKEELQVAETTIVVK